jgi:ABC-type polysaccharide/polyol phosphate transport system ATPase subunit
METFYDHNEVQNMEDDVVIKAEGLWKRYGIPPEKNLPTYLASLGYNFLLGKSLRRWSKDDSGIWALRDVSFEVKRGEAFGIIGRNGSGKSTLLKILAGTSPPTFGKITVKGRVFSMIELSAGMNPELSGRENVRLLATVMGFSPRWIARKLPEIEDFCELEEWFDRPVWQYSSGMMARLGFAVAINVMLMCC